MKRFFCVLLAALLLLTLAACSKAPEADPADEAPDWQTQYDLGVRYLSEGNYEEAIIAFTAAIEIEPKQSRRLPVRRWPHATALVLIMQLETPMRRLTMKQHFCWTILWWKPIVH